MHTPLAQNGTRQETSPSKFHVGYLVYPGIYLRGMPGVNENKQRKPIAISMIVPPFQIWVVQNECEENKTKMDSAHQSNPIQSIPFDSQNDKSNQLNIFLQF